MTPKKIVLIVFIGLIISSALALSVSAQSITCGDGWIKECYDDNTCAVSNHHTILRYDGQYIPVEDLNISNGNWNYLLEDNPTNYTLYRFDDTLVLPKNALYYFGLNHISMQFTVTPQQLNTRSTQVGANYYIEIPESLLKTKFLWDNKKPQITNNIGSTLNESDYWYVHYQDKFYLGYNSAARTWGASSSLITFTFNSWTVGDTGSSWSGNSSFSNFMLDRNTNHIILPDAVTDGLVLAHPMNGASGTISYDMNLTSNNNGTLTNMNTGLNNCTGNCSGWNTSGKFGNALSFDGVNDYVELNQNDSLNITSNITVETWVKFNSLDAYSNLVAKTNDSFNSGWSLYWNGNYIRFFINGYQSYHVLVPYTDTSSWHHVVGTYDHAKVRLYLDGVKYDGSSYTLDIINNAQPVRVGKALLNNYNTNGTIDEVRIYNRALTNDEINQTMNNTMSTTANLTLSYNFGTNYRGAQVKSVYTNDTESFIDIYASADNTTWYLVQDNATNNTYYTIPSAAKAQTQYIRSVLKGNGTSTPELYSMTILNELQTLSLNYISPTLPNNTYSNKNYTEVNMSMIVGSDTTSLNNFSFNWNDTNYSFYNDSLVLSMNFNNNSAIGENATHAVDVSKYDNNGTISGATWTTAGKFGGALSFDGVNDYVDAGNSESLNITDKITIEAWIKPIGWGEGNAGTIIGKFDNWRLYNIFTGQLGFRENGNVYFSDVGAISLNVYQHVVFTKSGTNGNFYVNGINKGSVVVSQNLTLSNNNVNIGAETHISGGRYFNGSIDNVRIYNRSLSASEIALHYQSELSKYNSTEWRFYNNVSALSDSTYTYYATANDSLGQSTSSATRTVTIDTVSPAIDFISPTDTNGTTVGRNYTFVNTSVSDSGSPNNLTALINFDNSLVGWWRFNENTGTLAQDYSGYGNNGTLINMNTGIDNGSSGWNSSGKFGNAISFDGVNDYILVSANPSLNFSTGNFSVSMWFNHKNNLNISSIISKISGKGFYSELRGELNNVISFQVWGGNSSNRRARYSAKTNLDDGLWHNVAFVYTSENLPDIYIDGNLSNGAIIANVGTVGITDNADNLFIGDYRGTIEHWNGSIDDVRIYNRALSAEEINASYNAGSYRLYHNFTGLSDGQHNYTAYVQDLAGNVNSTELRTLTIDAVPPTITLTDYYGLDSNGTKITTFNTTNLQTIEKMQLNFSIANSVNITGWYFNFTANGTRGCSLGNEQSSHCYNFSNDYPYNWIHFVNNTDTGTFNGTNMNTGDYIQVSQSGSGNHIYVNLTVDEHYNPNVFKWYDAKFNFDDIKWQNGTNQRITKNNLIKINIDPLLVPMDADQYKLDFRIANSTGSLTPTQRIRAFACSHNYTTGDPDASLNCTIIAAKYPSEFQYDGTKFRAIFTKNLIDQIGDIDYIILATAEPNPSRYYYIKTYKATASPYTTHWNYSNDLGTTWTNLGDGYETELNINWFYDGLSFDNKTAFVYQLFANTSATSNNTLLGNISWNIDATRNYPPLVNIMTPVSDENLTLPYNITFDTADPNNDVLNVSLYLYQNNVLYQTLITNMTAANNSYIMSGITDGTYQLKLWANETNTTDLFNVSSQRNITIDATSAASITSLTNTTGNFQHNWTWVNPTDVDYNYTMIYINNSFVTNTTNTYYNISSSPHNTSTISTHTVDTVGNINSTWVNNTSEISNNVPVIDSIGDKSINEGQWLNFTVTGTDLDSDGLTCSSDSTKGTLTGCDYAWNVTYLESGSYVWTFTIDDGYGGTDNETINVTIGDIPLQITAFWNNMNGWNQNALNLNVGNTVIFNVSTNHSVTNVSWEVAGSEEQNTSSLQFTRAFPTVGSYNVTAQAFSEDGISQTIYTVVGVTSGGGGNGTDYDYAYGWVKYSNGSGVYLAKVVTTEGTAYTNTNGYFYFGYVFEHGLTYDFEITKDSIWDNKSVTFTSGDYEIVNATLGTATISSWSNNFTFNDSLSFTVPKYTVVEFNATSNQTMNTWTWTGATEINGTGSTDTYAYKNFSDVGTRNVSVYGTNLYGTTQTVTWSVFVYGAENLTLSGYVKNNLEYPLEAARVDVNGQYVFTDVNGYYSITNISEENYTVLARAIEYINSSRTVNMNENITANFTLNEKGFPAIKVSPGVDSIGLIGLVLVIVLWRSRRKTYLA